MQQVELRNEKLNAALRQLRYRRFELQYHFSEKIPSGWVNNLMRGAFGATLRRLTCFCEGRAILVEAPEHSPNCIYAQLFETPTALLNQTADRHTTHAPHPFVLFTDRVPASGVAKAELVLFGNAMKHFPYLLMAFVQMGLRGIGRENFTYIVDEVRSENETVYDAESETIRSYATPQSFEPNWDPLPELGLRLITPLWLVKEGRQLRRFDLQAFFATLLRRLEALLICHQEYDPDWHRATVLAPLTEPIRVVYDRTRYIEKTRYSPRQDAEMEIGGLVGDLVLTGVNRDALALLELGELLHNGKKTSFGNGRYELFETERKTS